jgi:hypothetical protein
MATTFDPNFKSSNETLSGGNLVATSSGTGTACATRNLTSALSYFETTASTLTGTGAVGLVNRSYNTGSGNILGSDANGVGFKSNGAVVINGTTITTIQTYSTSSVIGVAINASLLLLWFTTNGTTWNNDIIANQNPVGNVGGISYSTMTLGPPLVPAVSGNTTGMVWTAAFTTFSYTKPTGYSSVDLCGATGTNSSVPKGASYSTVGGGTPDPVTPNPTARASVTPGTYGSQVVVSGTVSELSTPVAGRTVLLHQTGTGALLGVAQSAASTGAWSVNTGGVSGTVYAVAFDPTVYQGIVFDAVIP